MAYSADRRLRYGESMRLGGEYRIGSGAVESPHKPGAQAFPSVRRALE
jgi:hypothetical protein